MQPDLKGLKGKKIGHNGESVQYRQGFLPGVGGDENRMKEKSEEIRKKMKKKSKGFRSLFEKERKFQREKEKIAERETNDELPSSANQISGARAQNSKRGHCNMRIQTDQHSR
ncbi:hypothetical protein L1887_05954 [Cichorium endivia]|nr:hypothetical protein L1887_05954 [Cichorium endivia]